MADAADGPKEGQRIVMVCLDYSAFSEQAFNYYFNNVHKDGDYLIIMHVSCLHPPALPLAVMAQEWQDKVKAHEERIKTFEQEWYAKLNHLGINSTILVHNEGYNIGSTVCKAAKKNNVSLIVCGQRGMGLIRRTVLGSSSTYILHHSHVPVLVVPKHHGDAEIANNHEDQEQKCETPQAEDMQQEAQ